MVVLGTAFLVCGASPDLLERGVAAWKAINWRTLSKTIIQAAEYSRWFFTVVNATRDLYKRWP